MKLARSDPARLAAGQALVKLFTALAVNVSKETFNEHVEAALRAMGPEDRGGAAEVVEAAVTALIDQWEPTAWQRMPAPAEVRRAIFDARRARARTREENRRLALPEAAVSRDEVKRLIEDLAEKLGWGKDWRDDGARGDQQEAVKRRVKEILSEEERRGRREAARHRAHRPRARG